MQSQALCIAAMFVFGTLAPLRAAEEQPARSRAAQIVARLQRADYEGNQAAMHKCFGDLAALVKEPEIASRVRYWRGFAMWRRAINGFNDSVGAEELEEDLNLALAEFRQAVSADPSFADAKIAIVSCLGYLAFQKKGDRSGAQELYNQSTPLIKELKETALENPRRFWVIGPIFWNIPPERGGGQDKAIENYEKGLDFARRSKSSDPLEPSWGEPELLMNLAWSYLNAATPRLDEAERCARAALAIVPHWHYVRDILLPQIQQARTPAGK